MRQVRSRRLCAKRCAGWSAPTAPSGPARTAVPLGLPAIDALLPEGGLLTGALHEIEAGPTPSGRVAAHDGAALGFAAHLLGRFGTLRPTARCCGAAVPSGASDAPPYAPALAAWFDPARLLMVTVRRDEDLFWAMEEGLRCPGMAAVLGETRAADPTAGRRLSLAAEKSGVPALLLRAQPAPPQSVCTTRWRVASAPSHSTPGLNDLGASRWRIELRRNRFGTPSVEETPSWLLEWNDETHCLSVVPQALHGSAGARPTPKDWSARAAATVVWRDRLPAPRRGQPACPHRRPASAHAAGRCARAGARPRHDTGRAAGRPSPDRDPRQLVRPLHALGGDRSAGRRHRRGGHRSLQRRRLRRRCRPAARRHRLRPSLRPGRGRRARAAGRPHRAPGAPRLHLPRRDGRHRGCRLGAGALRRDARPTSSARRAASARRSPRCRSKACGSTRRSWRPS